jgi:transposase-like protein
LVLVASEAGCRVRLAHAANSVAGTLKRFADGQIAADSQIVTDGHAGYNKKSLGGRPHEACVQTKAERRENDAVQGCHWTIALLKRWLLGTHAGAVRAKHLQSYLDEFAFRHNRRKTKGVGRIAARVLESLVDRPPRPMKAIVTQTVRWRCFASNQPAIAWAKGIGMRRKSDGLSTYRCQLVNQSSKLDAGNSQSLGTIPPSLTPLILQIS